MSSPAWAALGGVLRGLQREGVEQLRVGWCDLHGGLRGKTLVLGAPAPAPGQPAAGPAAAAAQDATLQAQLQQLQAGVGMVGTLLLKDGADRTALPVFDPAAMARESALQALGGAANVRLMADPASLRRLPWAPDTAWIRAQAVAADGSPHALDTRHALQRALAALGDVGFGLRVGLELEFHVHRIVDDALGPGQAGWPAAAPQLRHIHPGYSLLGEGHADLAEEVLAIVRRTALGLGLPLRSLEIELGPSQLEAVFAPQDALAAADAVVLFRNGVRQALRRAGYHASFACKPPLPHSVASGWHLHQSLQVLRGAGRDTNAFVRDAPAAGSTPRDALHWLSDTGAHWLAGLRAHAAGMAALCVPSVAGYARFRGSVMAPQRAVWGLDNRGALLRVVGGPGDGGTRIENRIAEPMANPYLALAAQVWAGLDGLQRALQPGPACDTPYAPAPAAGATAVDDATRGALPADLGAALDALAADAVLQQGLGSALAAVLDRVRRQELARHAAADDPEDWLARELFARY